jgi:hypothetical protein
MVLFEIVVAVEGKRWWGGECQVNAFSPLFLNEIHWRGRSREEGVDDDVYYDFTDDSDNLF